MCVEEYKGYAIYKNDFGMYYYYSGTFSKQAADTIEGIRANIDESGVLV